MAMPRWDDGKIAIAGAMECKDQFTESQISWFENIEELNCSEFDFVLDASQSGQVTMIVDNEKILINDGNGDMLSHLKSLISLLLDMKIMDADWADIKPVLGKECAFKSISTSEDEAKNNIESLIRETLGEHRNSLLIHFQSNDFSLMDISLLLDRIDKSIVISEGDIICSISGEDIKDIDVKISFWYR